MNICDLLEAQAERQGETPSVYHGGGLWTYRELFHRIQWTSERLRQAGVKPGDVVAHAFQDELVHLVVLLATARLAATAFSLPLGTPELRRDELLRQVNATWLATDLQGLRLPGLTSVTITLPVDADFTAEVGGVRIRNAEPAFPWIIASGSGSTGRPKLMPVSHAQQMARMTAARTWLPYSRQDIFASLIHLDYYASKQRFLEAFAKGASIALTDRRQLNLTDDSRPGRVTVLYGTVFHMEQLLATVPATEQGYLASLTALLVGGSTVSTSLRKAIGERLCPRLHVLYGANESHTTCITRVAEVFDTPGSVGRPHEGIKLQVVDEKGKEVPVGTVGHVRVRGASCIDGYLGDEEATRRAFRDGWFYPGDLARLNKDGQLIHMGRADDMMIMNGINIYPAEIERAMLTHPDIRDAVALPFTHDVHQHIPVCVVVKATDTPLTEAALLTWARNRLGAHSPHRIYFVDSIPRNEQGKPVRSTLLEQINAAQPPLPRAAPMADIGLFSARKNRKQLDYRIRFAWHMPANANPAALDIWLQQIMENDLEIDPGDQLPGCTRMPSPNRDWLWRCLLLARLLLHGAGAPAFDPPLVLTCDQDEQAGDKWNTVALFPLLDEYPPDLYSSALGVAFGLAAWAAGHAPTSENCATFFGHILHDFLEPARQRIPPGKSTFEVLKVAYRKGIPFRHLGGGIFQLGLGARARLLDRSTTRSDSAMGAKLSQSKVLTARLLRAAGLPAPVHEVVRSADEALAAARRLGWPLVVKPVDRERGEGVTVAISDEGGLRHAVAAAQQYSHSGHILVEKQVEGTCHRLFIANDRLLYAVKRLPMGVLGDGEHTVAQLVKREVDVQNLRPPWKRSEIRPLDPLARKTLAAAGVTESTVPEKGVLIPLRPIESTEWGGIDEDVTARIHPENLRIAREAASLFGLHTAGIDIISTDIALPWHQNGAVINEVNFSPLLGGGEISRRHIPHFLDDYVPDGGRIPVVVFAGGEAAWQAATAHWQRYLARGTRAFISNGKLTLDAAGTELPMPHAGLFSCVRSLMLSARMEALVLVVQNDEFLTTGLPLDRIDAFTQVDGNLTHYRGEASVLDLERASRLQQLMEQWCARN